jgi:hypothetical protein
MGIGFPVKANYVTGEVLTATNMNDLSGTVNLVSGTQIAAGKNTLINGDFSIWQRGTSSSGNAYIADRWYSALVSGTGTFAQESTVVPTGSTYSMKFTASATAQPALYQAVETANATKFAGQTVTVSGVVAASASTGFTIDVQHSSSTDNGVTGTWTSITATSGGTATATSTTFVSISGVYAIPSTAKSLRVRIFTTSTIANTVVVYFDNLQLELGSIATTFQTATGSIQGELAACQRYFYRTTFSNYQSWARDTNLIFFNFRNPVTMRVNPSVSTSLTSKVAVSPTTAAQVLFYYGSAIAGTATLTLGTDSATTDAVTVYFSGATFTQGVIPTAQVAGGYFDVSSEL